MVVRKSAARLSSFERLEFTNAILAMKAAGTYDRYVQIHAIATGQVQAFEGAVLNGAHRGPAFLPWHRAMLSAFERDLQQAARNPSLALPYWDWTTDPTGQSVFTPELLGGNGEPAAGNEVQSGPFRAGRWSTVQYDPVSQRLIDSGPLQRDFTFNGRVSIPGADVVEAVMTGSDVYDSFPWNLFATPSFRNDIEMKLHDIIHVWVGGHMSDPRISPNDPVFYLHHANIDRLWARWQEAHPSATYVPALGAPLGQNLNDMLVSLNRTPAQVLDYRALGYEYDRPAGIRSLTGAATASYTNHQSRAAQTTITVRVPQPPQDSQALQAALLQWGLSYLGSDHHLRNEETRIVQPSFPSLPDTIKVQATLQDDSQKRDHRMDGAATVFYLSKELMS